VKNDVKNFKRSGLIAGITLLLTCGLANAQSGSASVVKQNAATQPSQNAATQSSINLIEATNQYKARSSELLIVQQDEVTKAEAQFAELRTLVSEGLVAKVELEGSEQKLATLRAQLDATRKQIADSDNMIAEIKASEELTGTQTARPVKLVAKQYGSFSTSATMLRYNGSGAWSLGGLDAVRTFFSTKFGRSLPTSAVGQSATHNRLGFDHHNAVDVAVHPDSSEGKALINYLQNQGIPFLAFRGAVPGVATGPHIHIGNPSHRLS
jgi:hypothetical protein